MGRNEMGIDQNAGSHEPKIYSGPKMGRDSSLCYGNGSPKTNIKASFLFGKTTYL